VQTHKNELSASLVDISKATTAITIMSTSTIPTINHCTENNNNNADDNVVVVDDDDDCSVSTTTPNEFVCPISLCVMKDPVVSKFGQNYDRQAILQWLKSGHYSCPLTRQPLKPSFLVPNTNLKKNILKWKLDHPEKATDDDDDDYNTADPAGNDDTENDSATSYFSMEGFIGTVDIAENRRDMDSAGTSTRSRGDGQRRRRRRERQPTEDDLSDLLALYEEVLELTAPTRPVLSTIGSDGTNTIPTTSTTPMVSTNATDFCDDDDLRDIRELYDEVLQITGEGSK
jgi:hypothetical protein